MKKLFAIVVAASFVPSAVFARGNHPMAGCGLGYVLLSNEDNNKVKQVLGATTNGTSGSQTFGISSGTSGCTEDGAVKFVKEADVFAEVNFESLRREMALGQGEFVRSFAALIGASEKTRPAYLDLFPIRICFSFPSATTTPAQMVATLKDTLAKHPELLS